jgi:glucose-6-phosphate isomerase
VLSELGIDGMKNFVAVCSSRDKALDFGILEELIFEFDDWVGGRFSVWGPIGMPVMIAVGSSTFKKFLEGASLMDNEFKKSETIDNLPIMLALIGIWHSSICSYSSRAILPYEHRLEFLPLYMQQLDMESNGKSVDLSGKVISRPTTPISWGQTGTNGQHAFYQFLHQSKQIVPCEFILGANCFEEDLRIKHHQELIANCLAQSEALMTGMDPEKSFLTTSITGKRKEKKQLGIPNSHFFCSGNRPSITLIYSKLNPEILGKLLSLFEHRTFVEGLIWNINSFDQWGVELGKNLARKLTKSMNGNNSFESFSSSTIGLVQEIKRLKD